MRFWLAVKKTLTVVSALVLLLPLTPFDAPLAAPQAAEGIAPAPGGVPPGGTVTGPARTQASGAAAIRKAMMATYIHGVDDELAAEVLKPEAIPVLRRLLLDPSFPRRDNIVAFLAHMDRGAATQDLLALLAKAPASLLDPAEDRAQLLAPQALGHIARRGDPRALEALLMVTSSPAAALRMLGAAAKAPHPAAYRADLIEMAFRGLAFTGSEEGRERLRKIAEGRIRLEVGGRDLSALAAAAVRLFDERLDPSSPEPGFPFDPRTDRQTPRCSADSYGYAAGGAPNPEDGEACMSGDATIETADTQANCHDSPLTYANHVAVTSPMTNASLDATFYDGNLRTGRSDFTGDVSCCARMIRSGNAATFGTMTDGLDVVDNFSEQSSVMNNNAGRGHVVRIINYCGGTGSNIIGCAWQGGKGFMVVRTLPQWSEGVLWMHEYGHNAGTVHNAETQYIMYHTNFGTNNGMNATECGKYHSPVRGAKMNVVVSGPCSDVDLDQVHGKIDNCPTVANFDQLDTDHDGLGDVCDP